MQRSLSIIKPDATRRGITGEINAMVEGAGLAIVAQKRVRLTREQVEAIYAEHSAQPWFPDQVAYMLSGPVVAQVVEGEGAVARLREVMGPTDFTKAPPGTIRRRFGLSYRENCMHGSDSTANAAREIPILFREDEIVG